MYEEKKENKKTKQNKLFKKGKTKKTNKNIFEQKQNELKIIVFPKSKIPKIKSKSKSKEKADFNIPISKLDINYYVQKAIEKRKRNENLNKRSIPLSINRASDRSALSKERSSSRKKKLKYEYQILSQYDISAFGNQEFNPRIIKARPREPLFSKYERLNFKSNKYYRSNTFNNRQNIEANNSKEIFPSELGIGLPFQGKDYSDSYSNIVRKKKSKEKNNKIKSEIKKVESTNYQRYSNNIKIDNKEETEQKSNQKERNSLIDKYIEKEFDCISKIEEAINNKKVLRREELSKLILCFIDILYRKEDKTWNTKDILNIYNYKINRIAKIIILMNNIDQIKVFEALKRTADSHNKVELYEKLLIEIEEIKKLNKNRKSQRNNESPQNVEGYYNRARMSKVTYNSIK